MGKEMIDVYFLGLPEVSMCLVFDNLEELAETFEYEYGAEVREDYLEEDWEELQKEIVDVHKAIKNGLFEESYYGECYQVWCEKRSREWFESLSEM